MLQNKSHTEADNNELFNQGISREIPYAPFPYDAIRAIYLLQDILSVPPRPKTERELERDRIESRGIQRRARLCASEEAQFTTEGVVAEEGGRTVVHKCVQLGPISEWPDPMGGQYRCGG